MYNILKTFSAKAFFLIKLALVALAYYAISSKIGSLENFKVLSVVLSDTLTEPGAWTLLGLILTLSLFNILLEAKKWQLLTRYFRSLKLVQALEQSLSSLTISLLTPNRIGEYGAKVLYFKAEDRPKVLLTNLVGNLSQMSITILFGLISLLVIQPSLPEFNWSWHPMLTIFMGVIMFLSVLWLAKKKGQAFLRLIKDEIIKLPEQTIRSSLWVSLIRYLVFSHQFYALLLLLGVRLDYVTSMTLVSSMYLLASIIPSFVVFDWLIKGSISVYLFGFYGVHEVTVLTVSSLMWVMNFALPAVAGSYYVMTFRGRELRFKRLFSGL